MDISLNTEERWDIEKSVEEILEDESLSTSKKSSEIFYIVQKWFVSGYESGYEEGYTVGVDEG